MLNLKNLEELSQKLEERYYALMNADRNTSGELAQLEVVLRKFENILEVIDDDLVDDIETVSKYLEGKGRSLERFLAVPMYRD